MEKLFVIALGLVFMAGPFLLLLVLPCRESADSDRGADRYCGPDSDGWPR